MAQVAVEKDGTEIIGEYLIRNELRGFWECNQGKIITELVLPKGSIKKLIGRELTWKDEPVELK